MTTKMAKIEYCRFEDNGDEVYLDPLILEVKFYGQIELLPTQYPDRFGQIIGYYSGNKRLTRRELLSSLPLPTESEEAQNGPTVSHRTIVRFCRYEVTQAINDLLWSDDDIFQQVTRPLLINNIRHRLHSELYFFRHKRQSVIGVRQHIAYLLSILQSYLNVTHGARYGADIAVFSVLTVIFFIDLVCDLRLKDVSALKRFCREFNEITEMVPYTQIFDDEASRIVLHKPLWACWWGVDEPDTREGTRPRPWAPYWQRFAFGTCALSMALFMLFSGNLPIRINTRAGEDDEEDDD